MKYTNKGSYRDVFRYLKLVLLNAMYFPSFGVGIAKKKEKNTQFSSFFSLFFIKNVFLAMVGFFFQANAPKLIETMVIIIN